MQATVGAFHKNSTNASIFNHNNQKSQHKTRKGTEPKHRTKQHQTNEDSKRKKTLFAAAARHVDQDSEQYVPENTKKACDSEMEFTEYFDQVFSNLAHPRAVAEKKVFGFIFYQSYLTH